MVNHTARAQTLERFTSYYFVASNYMQIRIWPCIKRAGMDAVLSAEVVLIAVPYDVRLAFKSYASIWS